MLDAQTSVSHPALVGSDDGVGAAGSGCLGALALGAVVFGSVALILNATQHGSGGEQRGLLVLPPLLLALPMGYLAGTSVWRRAMLRHVPLTRRLAQLQRVSELAHRIETSLRAHDDSPSADLYLGLASAVDGLVRDGFTPKDLATVGRLMPGTFGWLDPRSADYDAPRAPWQTDLAASVIECRRAVRALRTLDP